MAEDPKPEKAKEKSVLERHIQTVLQGIIAALVLWLGQTVNNAQLEITKLGVQMETVRAEIGRLQGQNENRYSVADAATDRQRIYEQINELKARIQKLER